MSKRAYRLEDYLKHIHCLSQNKPVHPVDLARALEVSKPTVTVFLKQLQEDGYVVIGAHHIIALTPKGLIIARQTQQRHQTIQRMLECLGVPSDVAASDACMIEHDLSPQSYEAIQHFIKTQKQYDET
ncbi:MAG: metal-dependent transcriptional regulator [Candidatus Limivicinus sp.]